jgi:hypothetical protein
MRSKPSGGHDATVRVAELPCDGGGKWHTEAGFRRPFRQAVAQRVRLCGFQPPVAGQAARLPGRVSWFGEALDDRRLTKTVDPA